MQQEDEDVFEQFLRYEYLRLYTEEVDMRRRLADMTSLSMIKWDAWIDQLHEELADIRAEFYLERINKLWKRVKEVREQRRDVFVAERDMFGYKMTREQLQENSERMMAIGSEKDSTPENRM